MIPEKTPRTRRCNANQSLAFFKTIRVTRFRQVCIQILESKVCIFAQRKLTSENLMQENGRDLNFKRKTIQQLILKP